MTCSKVRLLPSITISCIKRIRRAYGLENQLPGFAHNLYQVPAKLVSRLSVIIRRQNQNVGILSNLERSRDIAYTAGESRVYGCCVKSFGRGELLVSARDRHR